MARTEVHEPSGALSPPVRLTERLAALTMPCPLHPSIHLVEAEVSGWARTVGLEPDPVACRLAGRAFARCETPAVTSLARWLTWMSRLREEPAALTGALAVATGREPGPAPLERAFASLWEACAPAMSDGWRERFTVALAAGGDFGRRLFDLDLVELCLGVEVPAPVRRSPHWRALVAASGDVTVWCAEAAVTGDDLERSNSETIDRVVTRMEELWTAARPVPALTDRHDLGFAASAEVMRVACALLTIPRAYLEWLLETPRYRHLG